MTVLYIGSDYSTPQITLKQQAELASYLLNGLANEVHYRLNSSTLHNSNMAFDRFNASIKTPQIEESFACLFPAQVGQRETNT